MIEYKTGNLLNENADAIVNTVNCVGVMGRGIALQFKKQFPENFKVYANACKREEVQPGKMLVYSTNSLIGPKYVINFPTKRHWRGKSRLEDIEVGLKDLVKVIEEYKIKSIALPPLGCGLGGLDWAMVKKLIENKLSNIQDVRIIVFEPNGAPSNEKIAKCKDVPEMTPGRAALIELVHSYLDGLLDPFITLLEVHKLMYFMQEAGEDLRLKYSKAQYGPYVENLRHVLNHIEGHFISGYADGGDKPDKQLKLVPGAYDEAINFLNKHNKTKENSKKVMELVNGFETPFGLELLATVHWIINKENTHSLSDVIKSVYSWNNRKKQFSEKQIALAVDVLVNKKWGTVS